MLNYESRSNLYSRFNHSANVISVVGANKSEWRSPNEVSDNVYGVELEVSTDYTDKEIIDAFPEIFALVKDDSSISGSKMYRGEIVTIPATLRKHKRMWANFFKSLPLENFDTSNNHTNGMHIHVDIGSFEEDTLHLKKFCYFFTNPNCFPFFEEISERDKRSLNQWAKLRKNQPKKYLSGERELRCGDKYLHVNLVRGETAEVRLFKGIVSFASIIKNLEFTDSVVEFTRQAKFSDLELDKYFEWLDKSPPSSYRTLKLCLKEMNSEELKKAAEIRSIVEAARNTKEFLSKLKWKNLDNITRVNSANIYNATYPNRPLVKVKEGKNGLLDLCIVDDTNFSKLNDTVFNMFNRSQ